MKFNVKTSSHGTYRVFWTLALTLLILLAGSLTVIVLLFPRYPSFHVIDFRPQNADPILSDDGKLLTLWTLSALVYNPNVYEFDFEKITFDALLRNHRVAYSSIEHVMLKGRSSTPLNLVVYVPIESDFTKPNIMSECISAGNLGMILKIRAKYKISDEISVIFEFAQDTKIACSKSLVKILLKRVKDDHSDAIKV